MGMLGSHPLLTQSLLSIRPLLASLGNSRQASPSVWIPGGPLTLPTAGDGLSGGDGLSLLAPPTRKLVLGWPRHLLCCRQP